VGGGRRSAAAKEALEHGGTLAASARGDEPLGPGTNIRPKAGKAFKPGLAAGARRDNRVVGRVRRRRRAPETRRSSRSRQVGENKRTLSGGRLRRRACSWGTWASPRYRDDSRTTSKLRPVLSPRSSVACAERGCDRSQLGASRMQSAPSRSGGAGRSRVQALLGGSHAEEQG